MMIHAYDRLYLDRAMITLGSMLDFMVNSLGFPIDQAYLYFLTSSVSKRFEKGEADIIVGKSGIEIAYSILEELSIECKEKDSPLALDKSKEYWTGWALAYYQWKYNDSFLGINKFISIEEIRDLYYPYHEMDIESFCDKIEEIRISKKKETKLKLRRKLSNMTQRELSDKSGIPLRTLQEYEQGAKNINNAKAIYVYNLATILNCDVKDLLER